MLCSAPWKCYSARTLKKSNFFFDLIFKSVNCWNIFILFFLVKAGSFFEVQKFKKKILLEHLWHPATSCHHVSAPNNNNLIWWHKYQSSSSGNKGVEVIKKNFPQISFSQNIKIQVFTKIQKKKFWILGKSKTPNWIMILCRRPLAALWEAMQYTTHTNTLIHIHVVVLQSKRQCGINWNSNADEIDEEWGSAFEWKTMLVHDLIRLVVVLRFFLYRFSTYIF